MPVGIPQITWADVRLFLPHGDLILMSTFFDGVLPEVLQKVMRFTRPNASAQVMMLIVYYNGHIITSLHKPS